MTLTELKSKYEAENTYLGIGTTYNWNNVPEFNCIVDIEYTYDDWLTDWGSSVFKNLQEPYIMTDKVRPTELSFYVQQENSNFDRNLHMIPPVTDLLKIDCRITLTKEVHDQIRTKQRQYIDQQAERVFEGLKKYLERQPLGYRKSILNTSLWLLSSKGGKPENFDDALPFIGNFDINDEEYEANFNTIRNAYKRGTHNIDTQWVQPQHLTQNFNNAVSVMLAYVKFVKHLESLEESQTIPVIKQGEVEIQNLKIALDNGYIDEIIVILKTHFSSIPYDDTRPISLTEGFFRSNLYSFLRGCDIENKLETHGSHGRSDITIEREDRIYCFETKLDTSAEEALQQIYEKGYLDKYKARNKELFAIGLSFSKEDKNITDYTICSTK